MNCVLRHLSDESIVVRPAQHCGAAVTFRNERTLFQTRSDVPDYNLLTISSWSIGDKVLFTRGELNELGSILGELVHLAEC